MNENNLTSILTSQYKAGLTMLRTAIEKVPTEEWNNTAYNNPTWQIAYHTIFMTQTYLGANYEEFVPWTGAIIGAESLGGNDEWENAEPNIIVEGNNSQDELLSFIDNIETNLQMAVEKLPFYEKSGFEWYPFTRLELHLMNIRHIQHHTAQIIERLKSKNIIDFAWAIDGNPPQEW